LAYFTAHDDWTSQHKITIICRAIPHIMCSFPAITRQAQDTFLHSHLVHRILAHLCILAHLRILSHIFTFLHIFAFSHLFPFHHASSHFIVHLCISLHLHCDLVHIIAGASIHCPASSLVHRILFLTISDYVWHHMIIISLWTLTLHHLHT
jgi:hypothetical protein